MSIEIILKEKQREYLRVFEEYKDVVRSLQRRALEEILPDIKEQLGLGEADVIWANEYINDIGAMFRLLKRHKFVSSFTYEALRDILIWRLTTLKSALTLSSSPPLRSLPPNVRDPYGHPILILRLANIASSVDTIKHDLLVSSEEMRRYLYQLNTMERASNETIFQYVIIIDLDRAPLVSLPVDVLTWFRQEVHPRFHGFFSAAFVVNYSWTYSSIWKVVKHVLPENAVARIAFPSEVDLQRLLPSLKDITVNHQLVRSINSSSVELAKLCATFTANPASRLEDEKSSHPHLLKRQLSRFSNSNPYFGYPVHFKQEDDAMSNSQTLPELRHGRRRKRDLFRALLFLFWQRWKLRTSAGFLILVICFFYPLFKRRIRIQRRFGMKLITWSSL